MKLILLAFIFLTAGFAIAAQAATATADLKDSSNKSVGKVDLTETASGAVLVKVTATGLTPGEHAFHIHETGTCDAATKFESAGPHLAGGKSHGVMHADGPHPGDLPNLTADKDGAVKFETFIEGAGKDWFAKINLFDANGSSVVIHAKPDDHKTQPSGDSGDRVACGVLKKG
jgi:Cu-Zn family superoxide dismutase